LKPADGRVRPLAVALLTALDVEPARWVRAASRAGFAALGPRLDPAKADGIAYPSAPDALATPATN